MNQQSAPSFGLIEKRAQVFKTLGLMDQSCTYLAFVWASMNDQKFEELFQYLFSFKLGTTQSPYSTPSQCFKNATLSVLDSPETAYYVEGWATNIIPMSHAWFTKDLKTAEDPTWSNLSNRDNREPFDYVGFVFNPTKLRQLLNKSKVYGFLEGPLCSEIFSSPHKWLINREVPSL